MVGIIIQEKKWRFGDLYTFTIEPLELHIYYTFANDCLSEPGHYLQMISK